MGCIHIMLQGKGGAGKSRTCANLHEYFLHNDVPVIGMDTDPVNHSYTNYKEFGVKFISIMNGLAFDGRKFDAFMDAAVVLPEIAHAIVDNGASSFFPFCEYAIECGAIERLEEEGHKVVLHSVVTGGGGMLDTCAGVATLAQNFPDNEIVVWLNHKDGPIVIDGSGFETFVVYKEYNNHFRAVIEYPHVSNITTMDLIEHYARHQSFDATINSSLNFMVRHRVKKYWGQLVAAIDGARLLELA